MDDRSNLIRAELERTQATMVERFQTHLLELKGLEREIRRSLVAVDERLRRLDNTRTGILAEVQEAITRIQAEADQSGAQLRSSLETLKRGDAEWQQKIETDHSGRLDDAIQSLSALNIRAKEFEKRIGDLEEGLQDLQRTVDTCGASQSQLEKMLAGVRAATSLDVGQQVEGLRRLGFRIAISLIGALIVAGAILVIAIMLR